MRNIPVTVNGKEFRLIDHSMQLTRYDGTIETSTCWYIELDAFNEIVKEFNKLKQKIINIEKEYENHNP